MTVRLPRVIGHRGAAAHAPENTLAGLDAARRFGLDWVEVDVRLSGDGVPVLMHDATVDRTTDGAGRVGLHTLAALRALDAGRRYASRFVGERIPTLDEALGHARDLGLSLDLEIKGDSMGPGRDPDAVAIAVAERVAAIWPAGRPLLVSSFDGALIAALRRRAPDLPRGFLAASWAADGAVRAEMAGCAVLGLAATAAVDEAAIAAARTRGIQVAVFTVNEPDRAAALYAMGVDTLFSDRPDAILPVALRAG